MAAIFSSNYSMVAALMAICSTRAASLAFLVLSSLFLLFLLHFVGAVLEDFYRSTCQSDGMLGGE